MRQRLAAFIVFCFLSCLITAQNYCNGWINYSQQYLKFPVYKEGIYRIDSATLATRYNLSVINPQNFQLFIKGKEQFLYIKGEADGMINTGDYIEFYGDPMFGEVDSLLYTGIRYNPNPYVSLFSDTLYAFLTLNSSASNKRYQQETDTTTLSYPNGDYFYGKRVFSARDSYNDMQEYDQQTSDPRYTQAESWGLHLPLTSNVTSFAAINTYTAAPVPAYLSVSFSGRSQEPGFQNDHQVQIFYSDNTNQDILLTDTMFHGYAPARKDYVLPVQNLHPNGTNITFNCVNNPAFAGFQNAVITLLQYVTFTFPQRPDLSSASFYKLFADNESSAAKRAFHFSNFTYSNPAAVSFYDVSAGKRIPAVVSNNKVHVVIPNGNGRRLCVINDESQVIAVSALSLVNQTGYFVNYKSFAGSKPYVIISNKKLSQSATAYKNYRQSLAGGSYNVIPAYVDELYEQFSYGANQHPAAIRNFISFLKDSLPAPPSYVLLIGKSVELNSMNSSPGYDTINLVPTIGIPSSDNLFTANATNTNTNVFYPSIPIGRIASTHNGDINNYLAKVQQHESIVMADWKKRVLHFVGGDDQGLADMLAAYMSGYEQIIKDTLFGGDVYTFRKNTTAPIQLNISDSIKNIISNGAALLNFFGHGDQYGFDQAIDDPRIYNNAGKYPFVIANSCYSGNIHAALDLSVSENFVMANQKGSIGFLAMPSWGFVPSLHNYTGQFYKALSGTRYNTGVGDMIMEAAAQSANGSDPLTQFTSLEMTLNGDPAIKISNGTLPDYVLNNNGVSFDTRTYADSVGIFLQYKNSGKAIRDSFIVKIQRFYANGDSITVLKKVKAPLYKDSLKVYMLTDFNRGIGLNHFNAKVDYLSAIVESDENNNATTTLDVFIPGGDIVPVYPYKYAIVPKTATITLKASTTNPFAPSTTYRFQLDTCDKFIAPLQSTVVTSSGGVLEWTVNLPFADSTVYFWRVSKDSTNPSTHFMWRESSFQTIGSQEGWSQAHFNQFKNDAYRYVNYKKNQRLFTFENSFNSISCRNGVFLGVSISYYLNNIVESNQGCALDGWNFAVLDSISAQPQTVVSLNYPSLGWGQYQNWVCVQDQVLNFYSFGPHPYNSAPIPSWKQDMENFLNVIAPNNYVLAWTVQASSPTSGYAQISTYSNSLYTAFEHIGAVNIRHVTDTVPYILFGKKGMSAGQGHEVVGANMRSVITLKDSIPTRWHDGYIASEQIGPATKWNSLHWRVQSVDAGSGDHTILKLVGTKLNGNTDTLAVFPVDSANVLNLGNYVNAQTYPYLKLVAYMRDNVYHTPPQLKKWQILYDRVPECAINPLKGFTSVNDTLQEGDHVIFRFPIENISDKSFNDSLVITYWIEDASHNIIPMPQRIKAPPFNPGQVIIDTVNIDSYHLKGSNALWIYVNPVQNARYQLEQEQFNNIGRLPFSVNSDITNPLLDVTFDGVRILNGDIVSAKPTILITLKDENKFLALNDTSAFSVYLKRPDQSAEQRIFFSQGLQFTPANLPKNSASITYNAAFPVDGRYTLRVQARDRSNNNSGSSDYQIQFEISNKPTVTNVLNYPNPFTTSTRFVFTLTGSEVPEVFTIQIMTITGKVVREITRGELGNIHIGRNITDYAWDGRDNYGDRLGIGVYLYRVNIKLNGSKMQQNATDADKYFSHSIGKMVLMR